MMPDTKKMLYCFALAAFAQFHFVDIHPFIDGNGRICRFISKYILDSICPIPFPMFTNRKKYIKVIEKGRCLSPENTPKLLCELLLDTALDFYKQYVIEYTEWIPKKYFVACEIKELEEQLEYEKGVNPEDKEIIKNEFKKLEYGKTKDLTTKNALYKIEKEFDLDTL